MKVCLISEILDGERGVLAEILRARRALSDLDGAPAYTSPEQVRGGETWTCAAPVPKAPAAAPRGDDRVAVSRPRASTRIKTTRSVSPGTFALAEALAEALDLSVARVLDLAVHALLRDLPIETRAKVQRELAGGGS